VSKGCALTVVISDTDVLPAGAHVSIWDESHRPPALVDRQPASGSSRMNFTGLPAAPLAVCLSISATERCGQLLDLGKVLLNPDTASTLTLCGACEGASSRTGTMSAALIGSTDSVSAVIVSPVGEETLPFAPFTLRPVPPSKAGSTALPLGRYAPGQYRIDLEPALASALITVEAGVSQETAMPTDVLRATKVRVRDSATGAEFADADVHVRLGTSSTVMWTRVPYNTDLQRYSVGIGEGQVQFLAHRDGYGSALIALEDSAPIDDVILVMSKTEQPPVCLYLEDGGSGVVTTVDELSQCTISPTAACSGNILRATYGRTGERRMVRNYVEWLVSEPGQYVIRIPQLRGYRAVEPVEITVSRSGTSPAVVQLEAERPQSHR